MYGYRIVCFLRDSKGIAGKHLDQRFRGPHRPVDELLRWHFRQAVLANVKKCLLLPKYLFLEEVGDGDSYITLSV